MVTLSKPVKHGQEVDGCEHAHDIGTSVSCCITRATPDGAEDSSESPRNQILEIAANPILLSEVNLQTRSPAELTVDASSSKPWQPPTSRHGYSTSLYFL
jgi:hypothetical protein